MYSPDDENKKFKIWGSHNGDSEDHCLTDVA
jgi:hypothetical protein